MEKCICSLCGTEFDEGEKCPYCEDKQRQREQAGEQVAESFASKSPKRDFKRWILSAFFIVISVPLVICLVNKAKQCTYPGCKYTKVNHGNYCYAHTCRESNCYECKEEDKNYCSRHQALRDAQEKKEREEKERFFGKTDGKTYWESEYWGIQIRLPPEDELEDTYINTDNPEDFDKPDALISNYQMYTVIMAYKRKMIPVVKDSAILIQISNSDGIAEAYDKLASRTTKEIDGKKFVSWGTINKGGSYQLMLKEKGYYLYLSVMPSDLKLISQYGSSAQNQAEDTTTVAKKTAKNEESATKTGYATDALNVRRDASTAFDRVGLLKKGDAVTIVGEEGDFYKIKYSWSQNGASGQYAYVSKQYVNLKNSSEKPGGEAAKTEKAAEQANTRSYCELHGHSWENVWDTVHHEEKGHYRDVEIVGHVDKIRCAVCSSRFDTLDEYYQHFDLVHTPEKEHDNFVGALREGYYEIEEQTRTKGTRWEVDENAWDETVLVGRKCRNCGEWE